MFLFYGLAWIMCGLLASLINYFMDKFEDNKIVISIFDYFDYLNNSATMNFDYSLRAYFITYMLFGPVVLLLSISITSFKFFMCILHFIWWAINRSGVWNKIIHFEFYNSEKNKGK